MEKKYDYKETYEDDIEVDEEYTLEEEIEMVCYGTTRTILRYAATGKLDNLKYYNSSAIQSAIDFVNNQYDERIAGLLPVLHSIID